jgi:hypothetical protein
MPNFETFRRPTPPASAEPTITIGVRGILHLNKAAVEALGGCRSVELLCDRQAQIIGLRPAQSANAFALNRTRDGGGANIQASRFLEQFGVGPDLQISGAMRYPAFLDGDVLCADVSAPGTSTTSNRASA